MNEFISNARRTFRLGILIKLNKFFSCGIMAIHDVYFKLIYLAEEL